MLKSGSGVTPEVVCVEKIAEVRRLSPPSFPGGWRRVVLAGRAKPDHFFRNLEARGSKCFSTHEMGNCSIVRGHVRKTWTHFYFIHQKLLFTGERTSINLL